MNENYLIFKRFMSLEDAANTLKTLQENNIPGEIKFAEEQLDPLITGKNLEPKYELKISDSDFEKAGRILEKLADDDLANYEIDPDHYLYAFSNRELLDVIVKTHEWSPFDIALARNILKERKIVFSEEVIEVERQLHLDQLFKPEKAKQIWIVLGYIFAIFGGFLGLLIGYTFFYAKKVLPDGSKAPVYDEYTRKHAFQVFVISLIVFPIVLILQIWLNILEVV